MGNRESTTARSVVPDNNAETSHEHITTRSAVPDVDVESNHETESGDEIADEDLADISPTMAKIAHRIQRTQSDLWFGLGEPSFRSAFEHWWSYRRHNKPSGTITWEAVLDAYSKHLRGSAGGAGEPIDPRTELGSIVATVAIAIALNLEEPTALLYHYAEDEPEQRQQKMFAVIVCLEMEANKRLENLPEDGKGLRKNSLVVQLVPEALGWTGVPTQEALEQEQNLRNHFHRLQDPIATIGSMTFNSKDEVTAFARKMFTGPDTTTTGNDTSGGEPGSSKTAKERRDRNPADA